MNLTNNVTTYIFNKLFRHGINNCFGAWTSLSRGSRLSPVSHPRAVLSNSSDENCLTPQINCQRAKKGVRSRNGKNAELGIFSEMPSTIKCGVN